MSTGPTLGRLQKEVARLLRVQSVDPDTGLTELGIDSLNVVELILILDGLYEQPIRPDLLAVDHLTTLRHLDSQVHKLEAGIAEFLQTSNDG